MARTPPRPRPGRSVGNRFFVQVATRLGIPRQHRANAIRFLRAMQRGEGTMATWNPGATTRSLGVGETSFNSVGVRNYPTRAAGIRATAETFLNGHYDGIVGDLRRGVVAERIATSRIGELRTWGTGHLVARALGSIPTPTTTPMTSAPASPRNPNPRREVRAPDNNRRQMAMAMVMMMAQGVKTGESSEAMMTMLPMFQALAAVSPRTTTRPARGREEPGGLGPDPVLPSQLYRAGKGFLLPMPGFRTTHETSNLAGYPANDFMIPDGEPVYADFTGKVTRLSGKPTYSGGFGGRSYYITTSNGRKLFLTHFDYKRTLLRAGQRVQKGQLLGYVIPGSGHIHYAYAS